MSFLTHAHANVTPTSPFVSISGLFWQTAENATSLSIPALLFCIKGPQPLHTLETRFQAWIQLLGIGRILDILRCVLMMRSPAAGDMDLKFYDYVTGWRPSQDCKTGDKFSRNRVRMQTRTRTPFRGWRVSNLIELEGIKYGTVFSMAPADMTTSVSLIKYNYVKGINFRTRNELRPEYWPSN